MERTGDPWYRVPNCTGSPRGGGTPRSHTACSAPTASGERCHFRSLESSRSATPAAKSQYLSPPSVKCELSTDQATASTPLGTVQIGPIQWHTNDANSCNPVAVAQAHRPVTTDCRGQTLMAEERRTTLSANSVDGLLFLHGL